MKKLLHILTLSILFSSNISCAIEEASSYQSIFVQLAVAAAAVYLAGFATGRILSYTDSYIVKSLWWKKLKHKILLWRNYSREVSLEEELNSFTRLHRACENDDLEGVKSSVSPANINQQCYTDYNQKGYDWEKRYKTPLILACENGNTPIVSFLCSYEGMDPNISYVNGDTALHVACKIGNEKSVESLLSCKSLNVNKKNNCNDRVEQGQSAVEIAYLAGHKDIVVLLLAHDQIDPTGVLALTCKQNDKDMFDILIKHKNIKKFLQSSDALCEACSVGNLDMVGELLKLNDENCMKLGEVSSDNPLCKACERASKVQDKSIVDIVQMLLDHKFIKQPYEDRYHRSAMFLAIPNCSVLNVLPKADVHSLYWYSACQYSLLRWAVKKGNIPCVLWFLDNGADIHLGYKDNKGTIISSPFAYACRRANEKDGKHALELIAAWLEWQYKHEKQNFSEKTKALVSRCLYDSICSEEKPTNGMIVSLYEYFHNWVIGSDPYDFAIQKLLLKYAAFPKGANELSPLVLKASRCNIGLLNFFIDNYEANYTQQDSKENTPFFNAFMFANLTHPNQLTFFRKFDSEQKKKFIAGELAIAARCTLKHIAGDWWYEQGPEYYRRNNYQIKDVEKEIKKYNSFIGMCFKHGACDTTLSDELLNVAYETANAETKKEHFCAKIPVHAIVPHVRVREKQHKIDQAIAVNYAHKPMEYYLSSKEEKEKLAGIMAQRLAIS